MIAALRPSGLIKISIVLLWAVMMGLLVQKVFYAAETISLAETADLPESEEWTSIFLKGQKVGYSSQYLVKALTGYQLKQNTYMRLNIMGTVQELRTVTAASLGDSLDLTSFHFRMSAGPISYQLSGSLDGLDMTLVSNTGGQESRQIIRLAEVPRLAAGLMPYLARQGLEKGKKFRVPLFDPATLSTKPVTVEAEDAEKLIIDGEPVDTMRLRMDFYDTKTYTWVDGDGRTVKEEGLLGMSMVRTTAAKATEGLAGRADLDDLLEATSAPANLAIADPRKVTYLKVRLKGIEPAGFELDGGRQKLSGDVVEIRMEDPAGWGADRIPVKDAELREYLDPAPFVQSDDAGIIRRGAAIRGDEVAIDSVVRKITGWVFDTLEKRPTMSVPDAVQVLKTKVGDCNEHAALAAALLRSQGVPVRIAVGVLYYNNRFYYHAWLEVYGGSWMAVDPVLNQIPADATHIRFMTGGLDKQAELVRIMGRLEVDILDLETAP